MPQTSPLEPLAPWVALSSTDADWDALDPAVLDTMLAQLHLIRAFEEEVLVLAGQKLVNGPAHSSIGQEGGAVGSILPLVADDQVNGSHRGHHQFLAKALGFVSPDGIDPRQPLTDKITEVLYKSMAEIAGLADGYCRGRGGSMHLQWMEAGAMGTNAIVGGAVPFAAGFAFADKHADTTNVSVSYFGDGATNIGSVLETMNLAAAWKLPVCFFIENNQYAVSTTVEEATGEARLSARGLGFGIPSWKVDGMDTVAVYLAMQQALDIMRHGGGPTVIEVDTYRYFHQNGPFPGSAFGYRAKEEEQSWRDRDPIAKLEGHLLRRGLYTEADLAGVRKSIKTALGEIGARLVEQDPNGKPGQQRIRPALWPDPAFVDVGIRGDLSSLDELTVRENDDFSADELETRKYVDVVADVMGVRMAENGRIVVMGEDVHRLNGGSRGATKGLREKYEDRVFGTPISEAAFTGLGGGLAQDGRFYPVVELMYADFIWVAADQIFNQIGKARHMFGGDNAIPLVLRTKVAMGSGYGSQHLMDPAGVFSTSPGWRIVAPSTAADYIGLMNAALALDDPVLVIEHVDLYGVRGPIPAGDLDYMLPPGRAAIRREGDEVTVISYLSMVGHCLEAIEQSGVDAELVDLRWLDFASLDWDTIGASIRKTNNVLIVEQGARGTSYGGRLADELQRRFFDWLDQPIERVTGGEASPSISKVLERAAIARTEEVVAGLERIRLGRGGA